VLIEVFCPNCGTKADAGARFCERCGAPLPSSEQPPPTGAAETPPAFPSGWSVPAGAATSGTEQRPPPPPPSYGWQMPAYPPLNETPPPWANVQAQPGAPIAPFGAPLASWWQRVGALVLDGLVIGVPVVIVNLVLAAHFGHPHTVITNGSTRTMKTLTGATRTVVDTLSVIVFGLYFAILNGTGTGQTVGNRAPGIAVRDVATGATIGFWRGVLRWFVRMILYVAFVIPGLVNDLFPLWDSRRQTLADKAARSVMIRVK
jgi:hypothetical protein